MFFIVFTEYDIVKQPTGGAYTPPPVCRYVGRNKFTAQKVFKDNVDFAFSTASPYSGRTYFVGFDSDLDFIKAFEEREIETPQEDVTPKDISLFKQNLDVAICAHVLKHSVHRFTKSMTATQCDCCKSEAVLYKNAYGQYLCTDCWNDYLTSDRGQVEYMIGVASGEYKRSSFSNEDCTAIQLAWFAYQDELGKTAEELSLIEAAARDAGMFTAV